MSSDILRNVGAAAFLLITFGVLLKHFYMTWFKPAEFLRRAKRGVGDWWPFAAYFRSYYGSSWWLWENRIASAVILLVILYIVAKAITTRLAQGP